MKFEHSTLIQAEPKTVFLLYADVANWPLWDRDVKSAAIHGVFRSGATGEIVPNGGPKSTIAFVDVVTNERFAVTCKLPLCSMRFDYVLIPEQHGTRATHRVSFEGLLAPVFGRLIGNGMRKTLPDTLASLKSLAERKEGER
jgi:Polyketide cyclase / dehydrase and lipid transport